MHQRWHQLLSLFVLLSLVFPWTTSLVAAQRNEVSTDEAWHHQEHHFEGNLENNRFLSTVNATNSSIDLPEKQPVQYTLIYPWVVQLIGVVVYFVLSHYDWIRVPYAAVMFVAGMVMGVTAFRNDNHLEQFHTSIRQWSSMDSQLLLLVFLPGLIFRDAIELNILTFRKCFSQLLVLAFPMVLLGTVLTAVAVKYLMPTDLLAMPGSDDTSWSLALTIGSILASTDPVAVAAILKQADAPSRLQMHIGGESLLNDGAAVVFYGIFSAQFLQEVLGNTDGASMNVGEGILSFLRMSLGGVLVGLVFAVGLLILLYELDRRLEKENNVLQVSAAVSVAYMSYYVSEQVCQMSGVIACVTAGVCCKAFGSGLIADHELMDSYLKLVEHLLNTLLFALGGTVFGEVIANSGERENFTSTEWGSLFVLYVSVMLVRAIQVVTHFPIITRLGLSTNWREMLFFGFAGLRGAVGIALALSLDRSVREQSIDESRRAITSTVVGLAGGVSFLTLVINGSLAGQVLRRLDLTPPLTTRKRALRIFENAARDFVVANLSKLRQEQPRFATVPFVYVEDHLPFLSGVSQEYVDSFNDTNSARYWRRNSHLGSSDDGDLVASGADTAVVRGDANLEVLQNHEGPETLKAEIRDLFLKLLDGAYLAELSRGELDHHEDHGFNLFALRESVAFAVDDCHAQNHPLQDWSYANKFAHQDGVEHYISRFKRWLLRGCTKKTHSEQDEDYHRLRIRVIRALAFIEAHRHAEMELRSYMHESFRRIDSTGVTLLHLEDAILVVLEESTQQVTSAQAWLATEVSASDLQTIQAHHLATILLRKLSRFVEMSVRTGRLKEKEGRLVLAQIDRRMSKTLDCRINHEHGGSRRKKQLSTGSTASSMWGH